MILLPVTSLPSYCPPQEFGTAIVRAKFHFPSYPESLWARTCQRDSVAQPPLHSSVLSERNLPPR
jgi:hypothetical protein